MIQFQVNREIPALFVAWEDDGVVVLYNPEMIGEMTYEQQVEVLNRVLAQVMPPTRRSQPQPGYARILELDSFRAARAIALVSGVRGS